MGGNRGGNRPSPGQCGGRSARSDPTADGGCLGSPSPLSASLGSRGANVTAHRLNGGVSRVDSALSQFHPAVASWFARRFPDGPTAPQSEAWPHIAAGRDVLVASPTGTGKTLTGFLVAIDSAYQAVEADTTPRCGPQVLYVSPLRALAVDVHENLHVPLSEIREEATRLGYRDPELRVAIRTGDTPQADGRRREVGTRPLGHHARVALPPRLCRCRERCCAACAPSSWTRCTPWP